MSAPTLKDFGIDSKTITSAGGILLAALMMYFYYQSQTVQAEVSTAAVINSIKEQKVEMVTNFVDLKDAIDRNTAAQNGVAQALRDIQLNRNQ